MTGAILVDTRPDRMIRSAWRGEARNASQPKRAMSARAPTTVHHLDRAAGEAEGHRVQRVPARPRHCLLERGRHHGLLRVSLHLLVLEPAAEHVASHQLTGAELRRRPGRVAGTGERLALYLHSSAPRRHTYTKATISRADEHDRLAHGERPEGAQLHGDRVQEDDLDVEQDEQHRDQVEADPEPESALDSDGSPHSYGDVLAPVRTPRSEEQVQDTRTSTRRFRRAAGRRSPADSFGAQQGLISPTGEACNRLLLSAECGKQSATQNMKLVHIVVGDWLHRLHRRRGAVGRVVLVPGPPKPGVLVAAAGRPGRGGDRGGARRRAAAHRASTSRACT